MLVLGSLISERLRIEREIGRGGMGVVYLARHEVLGERFAVKVATARRGGASDARLIEEARAASVLRGAHVARVFDAGQLADGTSFLVMEYLEGGDLAALVEREGPLPIDIAAGYILEAAEAITEAHDKGLVHRDIKPANLFLTRGADNAPIVKLVDFGIARKVRNGDENPAERYAVVGSPMYMSPEQIATPHDVDGRSDVWSLAATLFELVAGRPAFTGESLDAVITQITSGSPPRLADGRAGIPDAFSDIVARGLERDRDRRFENIAAFAAALLPYASRRGRAAGERILHWHRATPADESSQRSGERVTDDATLAVGTSALVPLQIDVVEPATLGTAGTLALSMAPGRRDVDRDGRSWLRSLDADLARLRDVYRISMVVTLLYEHEYAALGVESLHAAIEAHGLRSVAFPIRDGWIPDDEGAVVDLVARIDECLSSGNNVVVHCRNGLGRTGVIVACTLVAHGLDAASAIAATRATRAGAIESEAQEAFVHRFAARTMRAKPDGVQ